MTVGLYFQLDERRGSGQAPSKIPMGSQRSQVDPAERLCKRADAMLYLNHNLAIWH